MMVIAGSLQLKSSQSLDRHLSSPACMELGMEMSVWQPTGVYREGMSLWETMHRLQAKIKEFRCRVERQREDVLHVTGPPSHY